MNNENCKNCSNCKCFVAIVPEILNSDENGSYAMECNNLVHPIGDCILKEFKYHLEK